MTSSDALYRREQPDSLVILGGGYIAVEMGYFFESMGTDVRIVEMLDTLVPREDPDIAAAFTEVASQRHDVYTGYRATTVESGGAGVTVHAEAEDGETVAVDGDDLLVALGRRPNSDTLNVEAAGIETDDNGFVVTDGHLETAAENVWAQGDIADNAMFKHSGDYETRVTIDNAVHDGDSVADFSAMPPAIFTEPQMAGVGKTEAELEDGSQEYVVGRAELPTTPMGRAKKLDNGFTKVLAAPNGEILGVHILGYEASTMIHETVVAMRAGSGHISDITDTIHAHPTLNKVVEHAFENVDL
jgi:dihydrolipoamide dehydrogenase